VSKIFTDFNIGNSLPELCRKLFTEQKRNWPQLALACEGLAATRLREIDCGYRVFLQHNPQRAVNSGAALDAESIRNRPCFLCAANQPEEQRGILYRNEYLILCNPAPVFPGHLTIVHVNHQPQLLTDSIMPLLHLARDLAPDYCVFYNGPACGASAPDHLHFQAIPVNSLPVENLPDKYLGEAGEYSAVKIIRGVNLDRALVIMESANPEALRRQLLILMAKATSLAGVVKEPKLNVIAIQEKLISRLIIFFRSKHRPDAFFQEDDGRIFVSPGSVDMGGFIITPRENDFQRLAGDDIRKIYREVSVTPDLLNKILEARGADNGFSQRHY